jgi:hypothetical protein
MLFSKMIILDGIIGGSVGQFWGKWRILDGRLRGIWIVNSELHGGIPCLCRLRPASVGSEWASIWNVLTHMGHMESPNWVASCVDELDDTLPHFMSVQWDSVWATHGVFAEPYVWKTALGPAGLFGHVVICCHSQCPLGLRVSYCQVYTVARLTIDSNLHNALGHGWWLVCRI